MDEPTSYWDPDDPDVAETACPACDGSEAICCDCAGGCDRCREGERTCPLCDGSGTRDDEATDDE